MVVKKNVIFIMELDAQKPPKFKKKKKLLKCNENILTKY